MICYKMHLILLIKDTMDLLQMSNLSIYSLQTNKEFFAKVKFNNYLNNWI